MSHSLRSFKAILAALLIVAVLVPIAAQRHAEAAILPGCTAVAVPGQIALCSYVTGGGRIQVTALTPEAWTVWWGPPSNPYAHTCGYGSGPYTFGCNGVPAGSKVSALVTGGMITVRSLRLGT